MIANGTRRSADPPLPFSCFTHIAIKALKKTKKETHLCGVSRRSSGQKYWRLASEKEIVDQLARENAHMLWGHWDMRVPPFLEATPASAEKICKTVLEARAYYGVHVFLPTLRL